MAIGGGDGDRRKLAEEGLMSGRKFDQMRGVVCRERKREAAESQYREEREKTLKKLYAHATVSVQICTVLQQLAFMHKFAWTDVEGFFAQIV